MGIMPSALIIDDNLINREVSEMYLKSAGYAVTACESGGAGIDKLIEQSFDVLLLDIHMPGMTGFEVLTYISSNLERSGMSIVVVTGDDTITGDDIAPICENVTVLYKPVNFDKLASAMKRAA